MHILRYDGGLGELSRIGSGDHSTFKTISKGSLLYWQLVGYEACKASPCVGITYMVKSIENKSVVHSVIINQMILLDNQITLERMVQAYEWDYTHQQIEGSRLLTPR